MFVAPIAVRDCGDEDPLVEIRSGHDLRQRAEDAEQARGAGHLSRAAGAAPDVVREQASIRRVQLIEQVPVQEVACALTGDHILDKTETAGKVAVGGGGGVGGGPRDGGGRRRAAPGWRRAAAGPGRGHRPHSAGPHSSHMLAREALRAGARRGGWRSSHPA